MRKLALFLVLVVMGLFGFAIWDFAQFLYASPGKDVVFLVKKGKSLRQIAFHLYDEKVIQDKIKFEILARLSLLADKIRVGEYSIPKEATSHEILKILSSGKSIVYKLTIQEGLNRYEISELFEKQELGTAKEFLQLTEDKGLSSQLLGKSYESLEGYLFPETYVVTKFTGARNLIITMVKKFLNVYSQLPRSKRDGMSRHETVILASIVEKETGAPEERGKIASVFFNRLRKGMRLQTDPTILYGILTETNQSIKNITRKDIETPTRYNTYTFAGLPPGPISNPGRESLEATLSPDPTRYLYFVSRNDGTSYFSKTLKEHNKAVDKYQKNRKARQDKSWRDLGRKRK